MGLGYNPKPTPTLELPQVPGPYPGAGNGSNGAAVSKTALLPELLHEFPLLTRPQLQEFDRLTAGALAPDELAQEVLQRRWLTPLQMRWLLRGRGSRLTLGPYVLLDRLGSGGMGQVFRSRHRLMGRLAA